MRRFLDFVPRERHRLFVLTLIVGVVCGVAAVAFHGAIKLLEHTVAERALHGTRWMVWVPLIAALGALMSGVLLEFAFPNARGSGVPQVKVAYAIRGGELRLRDAIGKFVISALQIGTGSSLGREGPTVHICAGLASALGRLFALSPRNLRRLLPVGAAAGIAAAFNAPIAAVTFVIEEIVGDLDQTLLSGVVVAAALASVIERSALGAHPILQIPATYTLRHASSLPMYVLLGVTAALVSDAFYVALLRLRAWFRDRVPATWAHPAFGGLVTGGLAVAVLAAVGTGGITGDGYATLSRALAGRLPLHVMLLLLGAKWIATICCYASGGSGGIFAPVLFVGGMLGGCFGFLDRFALGHADANIGAFALIGMGAYFAAVIRAPITSVLIIFEMTGGYGLILPLMIASASAFVLSRRRQRLPIYEALLEQDGQRLPDNGRLAAKLSRFRVADAMTGKIVCLPADLSIADADERVSRLAFTAFPVLDAHGRLAGLISAAKIRRTLAESRGSDRLSAHVHAEKYLRAEQPLSEAVVIMERLGARQMAVVRDMQPDHISGILAMSDVMRAYARAARDVSAETNELEPKLPSCWPGRDADPAAGPHRD